MSELINNREYRQKALKEIILELHQGKSIQEVKEKFDKIAVGLEPAELSLIEQGLINEGLPVEEVQRLCDVHAAVFREALEKKSGIGSVSWTSSRNLHSRESSTAKTNGPRN
jgi:DUF438 domain-containing protein